MTNISAECQFAQSSDERAAKIFETWFRAKDAIESIDDRQLLWLLKRTFLDHADTELFGYADALIDTLENRLYPVYDGDAVQYEEWGWSTPNGPLIYDQVAYDKERAHLKLVDVR